MRPFRGLRYVVGRSCDPGRNLCPPYDVVTPEVREYCYSASPYNVVRIEAGMDEPDDGPHSNRYVRAARFVREWVATGVLSYDGNPSIYVHKLQYSWAEAMKEVVAVLCLVELARDRERDGVLPHERTLDSPKSDRLELLRHCLVSTSPVVALYQDPHGSVAGLVEQVAVGEPCEALVDLWGARHRLWLVSEPRAQAGLMQMLGDRALLIADGHHRYETAQSFAGECATGEREGCAGERARGGAAYVLVSLVSSQDPGLLILPTHRLLKLPSGIDSATALAVLGRSFKLNRLGSLESVTGAALLSGADQPQERAGQDRGRLEFATALPDGVWGLSLRRDEHTGRRLSRLPAALRSAVSAVMEELAVRPLLGLGGTGDPGLESVEFTHDADDAIRRVRQGECSAAVMVRPYRVDEVWACALAGELMPRKSTYFYPKFPAGLVMFDLEYGL